MKRLHGGEPTNRFLRKYDVPSGPGKPRADCRTRWTCSLLTERGRRIDAGRTTGGQVGPHERHAGLDLLELALADAGDEPCAPEPYEEPERGEAGAATNDVAQQVAGAVAQRETDAKLTRALPAAWLIYPTAMGTGGSLSL